MYLQSDCYGDIWNTSSYRVVQNLFCNVSPKIEYIKLFKYPQQFILLQHVLDPLGDISNSTPMQTTLPVCAYCSVWDSQTDLFPIVASRHSVIQTLFQVLLNQSSADLLHAVHVFCGKKIRDDVCAATKQPISVLSLTRIHLKLNRAFWFKRSTAASHKVVE